MVMQCQVNTFAIGLEFFGGKIAPQYTCWIWFTSDQLQLRSISQKRAGWFLHTGLLPDRIRLAKTWRSQPEPNRIQAGFAQYDSGHLWKNATESESGKNWQWASGILPELGAMILAHWLASGPDALGWNLTRPSRSDPGRFCTIWSRPSLEEQNQIRCRELDPAQFWLHAGHIGHDWLDPKCFGIRSGMFTGH